jgi:hypothetical protein
LYKAKAGKWRVYISRCGDELQACLTLRPARHGHISSGIRNVRTGPLDHRGAKEDGTVCASCGDQGELSLAAPPCLELTRAGTEIVTIKEFLGHASIASSERYARVSNQKVKQEYLRSMQKILHQSKVEGKRCEYFIPQ